MCILLLVRTFNAVGNQKLLTYWHSKRKWIDTDWILFAICQFLHRFWKKTLIFQNMIIWLHLPNIILQKGGLNIDCLNKCSFNLLEFLQRRKISTYSKWLVNIVSGHIFLTFAPFYLEIETSQNLLFSQIEKHYLSATYKANTMSINSCVHEDFKNVTKYWMSRYVQIASITRIQSTTWRWSNLIFDGPPFCTGQKVCYKVFKNIAPSFITIHLRPFGRNLSLIDSKTLDSYIPIRDLYVQIQPK